MRGTTTRAEKEEGYDNEVTNEQGNMVYGIRELAS